MARAAAASMTCSQLSRITNAELSLSRSNRADSPPGPSTALTSTSSTWSAGDRALEPRQPDAVAPHDGRRRERATDRDRCRGLPDASRAHDLDEPVLAEQVGRSRRPRCRGRPAPPPGTAGCPSAGHGGREPAESGTTSTSSSGSWARIRCSSSCSWGRGSRPSSVASSGPDLLEGRQGVGLPPGAVLGGDEQLPQALLVGGGRDGGLQLSDHDAEVAQPQPCRELDLEELEAGLLETRSVRGDPVPLPGSLEHLALEPVQRRQAQVSSATVVAIGEEAGRGGRGVEHRERVDVRAVDLEGVAAATADDQPPGRGALGAAWRPSTAACCAVVAGPWLPQRSSTRRSARTSSPASRARRTTSSEVLPIGTAIVRRRG